MGLIGKVEFKSLGIMPCLFYIAELANLWCSINNAYSLIIILSI